MPKYKIHIDKPLPNKQEISRYKDFDRLYGQYETATRFRFWRNLRTNPRYFATLVMIIAVGYLVWEAASGDFHPPRPWVAPPLSVELPYETQSLQIDQEYTLQLSEHLQVSLPAYCFVDTQGQPISGPVTLAYRELLDARDLFLAGVPMRYDSAGQEYLLESGGMVELKAFKDSQEVFLGKGLNIQIEYLVESGPFSYEAYALVPEVRSWQFRGKDSVVPVLDEAALIASLPPRPRLQGVQDLQTGEAVDELELIPKGVRPPDTQTPAQEHGDRIQAWESLYDEARAKALQQAPARHYFSLDRLGYHCLGRVLPQATGSQKIVLTDQADKNLSRRIGKANQVVWVVQKGLTTLRPVTYTGEGRHLMAFYPDTATMIWTLTPEGQLVKVGEETLAGIGGSNGVLRLPLLEAPSPLPSLAAAKAFLEWEAVR